MKQILIIIVAALLSCHDFAQDYANNWVFGDSAGLNFSTEPPAAFNSVDISEEACASISDSMGNLLFYTNSQKVWNKNNIAMPNGDSLKGGGVYVLPSSITQGVIIVRKPGSNHLYYIFYLSDIYHLQYSIVDMNLDGGLGDVIEKNVELYNYPVTEKMQAVKHGNGRDWWLVLYQWPDEIEGGLPVVGSHFKFITFLITPYIILGPYLQEDSLYAYKSSDWIIYRGQMKFSLSGERFICTQGQSLGIYNFDRCSGLFGGYYELANVDSIGLYGAEFSADGNKIYSSSVDYPPSRVKLYQYCLNCNDSVQYTKQIIYSSYDDDFRFSQMQLGPDEKIYVINWDYSDPFGYIPLNTHLSVINEPEKEGIACNMDTATISLGDKIPYYGLPNLPNYNLGPLTGSDCDTLESGMGSVINSIPGQNNFSIYPNPATNYFTISGNINGEVDIELFNLLGQTVFTKNNISLNSPVYFNGINAGMYEVVIKKGTIIIYTGKLVVN